MRPAVLADARRIADAGHGWAEIRKELDRSRRYGRIFSLVAIQVADADAALPKIRGSIRGLDHAWCDKRVVYVLLPESARDAATALLERLAVGVGATAVGAAAFPEDAVTLGALIAAVSGHPADAPTPRTRLAPAPLVEATEPQSTVG